MKSKRVQAPAITPSLNPLARTPRIAYVTTYDASDVSKWSGTGFHVAQALRMQGFELELLGPLTHPTAHWPVFKAKGLLYNRILRRRYFAEHDITMARHYAASVEKRLRERTRTDLIFSPGTIPVAFLESENPIAFWSDATHAALFNFYPEYSDLCPKTIQDGHQIEQNALDRAAAAIFSSDWAAESAVRDYGADPARVHVVPYGANMEAISREAVEAAIQSRSRSICKLLFIGVDWERKGGDMALAVARQLNEIGLPTELTIIGCSPFAGQTQPDFVRCEGFLSKLVEQDRAQIMRLLAESHFLIVPSLAECFGIVYCEASSFGVPSIARRVGGVPTAVKHERNGFLFDLETSADTYVSVIVELFRDYASYSDLARSSLNEFQTRLNWGVAGRRVREILLDAL